MSALPRVDQLLAGFAEGDAISSEARGLQAMLRRMGSDSEIYADESRVAPSARGQCRFLAEYHGTPNDVVLHHYAIASPATRSFLQAAARKVLVYHNITPTEFFTGFDDDVVRQLQTARAELRDVAARSDAVWAVSRYNAAELERAGVPRARVFPLLFTRDGTSQLADPAILRRFAAPLTNILLVGRMAPNKCVEDLIQAFAWYQRINPFSRLILVGSRHSTPRYFSMLRMLAGELDLTNVCFENYASPEGLAAYYRLAHVFVSASRHEGYCLPLLEAMEQDVPVIARSVGGTPEAMDGAGVLYEDLNPGEMAELIHQVVSDTVLRETVLVSQRRRMEAIRHRDAEQELRSLLAELPGV
ncbi:MAG: glycosyltransferase [Verrucomicrobia bacterium]|nr:glycosyltransferase [Verrucomicrobiota bacterium]MBU1735873.1 glycosyltransferase [Verrucomicrobiota bacterium]MBU1855940.1 glycosyltransferase [Verrucomicrobiota bacterium]